MTSTSSNTVTTNMLDRGIVPLYPYQKRWIKDPARFLGCVKSVQTGFTWATALKIVLSMLEHGGETWLWMSGSQRQSREAAEYAKKHLNAMSAVGTLDTNVEEFFGKSRTLVDRIVLPNGSRAFFLPANPDTARGFAGNVVLDEFAIHEDAKEIWAAMFGRVSRGYRLIVFSSPKGAVGKFWELAKQWGLADGIAPATNPVHERSWSAHWIDIHLAIREGAPLDAEALRVAMGDDDLFAQEYLCVFRDAESQLIPTDLVEAAVSSDATMQLPLNFIARGPIWMGTDVGRVNDWTVHSLMEQLGERFIVRAIDIQRKATFAAQKERVKDYLPLVRRGCIDATGIGAQNAEELEHEFPGRVEGIAFGEEVKSVMAMWMKRRFEDHQIEIPNDVTVKNHIKAVKRVITPAAKIRFDARRTKDGHADIFWALALAGNASDQPCMPMSEGVLAGRGIVTAADVAQMATGIARKGDWRYPDHSDDRKGGRGWRGAL